jgi:hypothetical protein
MTIMNSSSLFAIENLRQLKSKLQGKQMSVLVGAGFSKNVHHMFPSWWELLFDMAYFLNGKQIEKAYENTSSKKRGNKKQFIDDAITDFIDNVGYLDLVTKYVSRKGFQESIATYIEEKTPIKIDRDGKRFLVNRLRGKDNEAELLDSMLDLHSSLINLPWNNIFTTNYDEMLELANDTTSEEKLFSIKGSIEKKNKESDEELSHCIVEKKALEEELAVLEERESPDHLNALSTSVAMQGAPISEIQEKRGRMRNLEYDILRLENSIASNDAELLKVKKEIEKCLKTVTHSSNLAIKRNRNIIKLHGSIRNESHPYGFDNDIRSHYVISREDYDQYPQKHEAFTQLMRISLLQESYCLIGFSGVDPNFLEWIKWVRDVLEKSKDPEKNYKIYLVEVGENKGKDEKELFYENFRICKISLDEASLIHFMENESGIKLDVAIDRKKALLSLLFSYLREENFDSPKLFIQQYNISKYMEEWSSMPVYGFYSATQNDIKESIQRMLASYDAIMENKNSSRLKLNSFVHSRNKSALMQYSILLLKALEGDRVNQKKLFDLILTAAEDLRLPVVGFWNPEDIKYLEGFPETELEKTVFGSQKLRGMLLYGEKKSFLELAKKINNASDLMQYELALFHAFSFDFKKMQTILKSWHPGDAQYILKRSGLIALADPQAAGDYLRSNKAVFESSGAEELLFYFQTIYYINPELSYARRKKNSSDINILQNKGFNGIHKHLESILDDLKTKAVKIDRYGAGRFSTSNEVILSRDLSKRSRSVQFVQLLIELGLPLRTGSTALRSAEEWYEVCRNIYEEFPVPCLFYSLQYSNDKVIRRIGQDYAYSEDLREFNRKILPDLLEKYLDETLPVQISKSILYFCSELFTAVDPKIWEDKFIKIWKRPEFEKQAFDARRNEEYTFVSEALKAIRSRASFTGIILSCLNNFTKNSSTDFLYFIANNDTFRKINIQTAAVSQKIHELIPKTCSHENLIFVFGNLNKKLTAAQQNYVLEQFAKVNFKNVKDPGAWRILYAFSKKNSLANFKKGLLQSGLLFDTGFSGDGKSLSMGNTYVSLNFLYNDKIWSKTESRKIYRKLTAELTKIEAWMQKRPDTSLEYMLREMLTFLETEIDSLSSIKTYNAVKGQIIYHLSMVIEYNSITEAIISDNKSEIINALADLSAQIEKSSPDDETNEALQLVLARLLFQNDAALEASLNYIAVWISEKSNAQKFLPFKNILKLIINKYSKNLPKNVAIPFVQKQLIAIGESYLNYLENDQEVTANLLKIKETEFFN